MAERVEQSRQRWKLPACLSRRFAVPSPDENTSETFRMQVLYR